MITPHDESNGDCQARSSLATCYAPFQRGRTGIKGRTKYIQAETGSWVTLNENGDCHLGAFHEHLGTLLDVARELKERKDYADAWRINMQRAERERDAALAALKTLVDAEAASRDQFTAREIDGIEAAMKSAREPEKPLSHERSKR